MSSFFHSFLTAGIVVHLVGLAGWAQTGTLTLASGSTTSGAAATLALNYTGGPSAASSLQWTISYPPGSVSAISANAAASATAAGKLLNCTQSSSGFLCLVTGLNLNSIQSGPLATVSVTPAGNTSIAMGMSSTVGAASDGTSVAIAGVGGTLSVQPPAAAATLSSLTCMAGSVAVSSGVSCNVALTSAVSSPVAITLQSNTPYLQVPVSVTVGTGASSVSFTAISGVPQVMTSATITASLNGVSRTASISINPPTAALLSAFTCTPDVLPSGGTSNCTVTLSAAAVNTTPIIISSSSPAVSTPSNFSIAAGASAGTFPVTAGAVSSAQNVNLTAAGAANSMTFGISISPAAPSVVNPNMFYLKGEPTELAAVRNGAVVTPSHSPTGGTGTLVMTGQGAVNFVPAVVGNGMSFTQGGQQRTNAAFYSFLGLQARDTFDLASGQVTFYLKSRYSFADRQALPLYNYRWVYDVWDNSNRLYSFYYGTSNNRLIFWFQTGSSDIKYFFIPDGTEDTVFGCGVALKVKLTWDGKVATLYLNDKLVSSQSYTKAQPNWTLASSFAIGGEDQHVYGGGYFSNDDIIDEFQVAAVSAASPTGPSSTEAVRLPNTAAQSGVEIRQ